ncbi:serine/threonine-protein kinase AFC1 [Canna indica]|uniref:dual-specificity kinase n=1 Tax=Canna indica TaxID=4628 RepID=A0AAQ3QH48_9LILI|nr:serine/threonine-protein kinase AFC1 [Canna indica]
MEPQWTSQHPRPTMIKPPRKRARLGWDVPPPVAPSMFLPTFYFGQEIMNGASLNQLHPFYYAGVPRYLSPPRRADDMDGHYVFGTGETLTPRYRILSKMGAGTFGQVLECWDIENKETVAIKIVFEKLGPSLYDFLRSNGYRSFPVNLVREIGRQLLESVAFMHDLRLIHTDLKPENILLVSSESIRVPDYKFHSQSTTGSSRLKNLPRSSAVKLIDFGSTTFENQNHSYVVSTRHYRAPEVILGLGWNYPCDMWSVGCILIELCSGKTLFQTHENLEHLAMMERVLGPLPQHMVTRADRRSEKYFRPGLQLDWPEGATSSESTRAVCKLPRLHNLVARHADHSAADLIDLLEGLLHYDPAKRIKAREALTHPFFTRDRRIM